MNKYNKKQIKISQIYKKKKKQQQLQINVPYITPVWSLSFKSLWCQQFQFSVLTILQSTQVLKAAGLDNLSGCFLKDGEKF